MRHGFNAISEVCNQQLCNGCGACAGVAPKRYHMVNVVGVGLRPELIDSAGDDACALEKQALSACPGVSLYHSFENRDPDLDEDLCRSWGPIFEVWEGYATDADLRRTGSSGGAATALAIWALERGGMHGVLHTAAAEDRPYLNRTVMSRSRAELLAATGSRYAPASPAEGLPRIVAARGPCVFIGKPCDAAGVQKARRLSPELDEKLGLVIAFFCAGTPSTQATLDLMAKVGVPDPSAVTSLRYRGNGWPGEWVVRWRDGEGEREARLSYADSWDFLQRYRQWRCYICPDHTGEFADIAVGDPWYRPIEPGEPGSSLILARTPRGRQLLHRAEADGYITLLRRDHSLLARSQPNLLRTRGRLWGQLLAMRLAGVPAPQYVGFSTFHRFVRLRPRAMAESLLGTIRRYRAKARHSPIANTSHQRAP